MIDFREELYKLSSSEYKEFQQKLVPNANIIGVKIPKIRKYAKGLNEEEKEYYLKKYSKEYLEEIILMGLIICDLDTNIEDILNYTKSYVDLINDWCSCDIFCSSFHITNKYKDIVFNFLNEYLYSDREFYIRFGLVMLINYYICDEYIDEIFKIIDNIRCTKYYDKMALSWLISVIYIYYKDRVIKYLKKFKLDKFTQNMTVQKIIESNRVSQEEKESIRDLKIS